MKTISNQSTAILVDGDNASAEQPEDVIRFVSIWYADYPQNLRKL